jgi:Outer membrane protein Omp28
MEKFINLVLLFVGVILFQACTKTESEFTDSAPETITVKASALSIITGNTVTFLVASSVNNNNVTASSKIYVNGALITGSSYTFSSEGNFAVYATYGQLTSSVITVNVAPLPSSTLYKHNVLVEEYSGTWCGNCPRILYGVDLLEQQTNKAVVVSTHLFGSDPFISADGNSLAAQQGVGGVPSGFINRTLSWTGPQYQNVNQVISTIQASSSVGLAINSIISGNNLSVNIKVNYSQPLSGTAKLTVYLVEDKLYHTQSNYSANLYGGLSSIPNFEYNGVIRKIISPISGDNITISGNNNSKDYSLALPSNLSNISNARIVAFVTNASGMVVNVLQAKVGETKVFETI